MLRADKPQIGFTWELRQYGKGTAIIASGDLFPSQAEARRSGVEAYAKLMATGEQQAHSDTCSQTPAV